MTHKEIEPPKKFEPLDYIELAIIAAAPFLAISAFGFTFWVDLASYVTMAENISNLWSGGQETKPYIPSYQDGWSPFPAFIWMGLLQLPQEARWPVLATINASTMAAAFVFLAVQVRLFTNSRWGYVPIIIFMWHPMTRALSMSINSEHPAIVIVAVFFGLLLYLYRHNAYDKMKWVCACSFLVVICTFIRANAGAAICAGLMMLLFLTPHLSWQRRLILPIIPACSFAVGFLLWPLVQFGISGQFITPGNEMGALAAGLSYNCSPSEKIFDGVNLPKDIDKDELLDLLTTVDFGTHGHRFPPTGKTVKLLADAGVDGHEIREILKKMHWNLSLDPPIRMFDRFMVATTATGVMLPARIAWLPAWTNRNISCYANGPQIIAKSRDIIWILMDLQDNEEAAKEFKQWYPTNQEKFQTLSETFAPHIDMQSKWKRDPLLLGLLFPSNLANLALFSGIAVLLLGGPWRLILAFGAVMGAQTLVFFIAYLGSARYAFPIFPIHLIMIGLLATCRNPFKRKKDDAG